MTGKWAKLTKNNEQNKPKNLNTGHNDQIKRKNRPKMEKIIKQDRKCTEKYQQ